jgi:MoaA/NifB/PqqE/SkfB family radical SAM enzyme
MALKYSVLYNGIIENGIVMGKPVSGFFELTSRCNFRCKMCYVCGMSEHQSLIKKELTTAQWIDMGKQARDAGVLFLVLTGGEIFMRKDFWEIYEALGNMGFIITLYTNGSLLNDDMIQRLAKQPPLKVSISVYGASAATYEKVTECADGYDKTITNIKKLINAGISVELKTTVIKANSEDFEELADLARSMGKNMGIVNYITPRREGSGTDPVANRLTPLEMARFEVRANNYMKHLYDLNKDAAPSLIIDDVMSDGHIENAKKIADTKIIKKTAFRCTSGKCAFWLSWEGKLFPCGLLSDIQANPLAVGFENAWQEIWNKSHEVPSCQECDSCSYFNDCMSCPARLKLETGEFTKPAPYLCEFVKALKAENTLVK